MAQWRLFRSGNNRLRLSQSPAETNGSIVMVAVETTSARISTRAVKFPTGAGFRLCNMSPRLDRHQSVANPSVPEIGLQPFRSVDETRTFLIPRHRNQLGSGNHVRSG